MKKFTIIIAILFSGILTQAQDITEISRNLLGKSLSEINPTLDSLGVWYYNHGSITNQGYKVALTIKDSNSASFAFYLYFAHNKPDKIIKIIVKIEYGSSNQVAVLNSIVGYNEKSVGVHTTDIIYLLPKRNNKVYTKFKP